MFTVIEFSENIKGSFGKFFGKIIHEMPELTKVAVKDGAPYFKIKVKNSKKLPWEDIMYMAGRCASNVLIREDIQIPKDFNIHRFEPKEFKLITLLNTAKEVLAENNIEKIRLGISDPEAVLVNRINALIDFVSEIRIFTRKTEKYFRVCEQVLDEYGISIVLSDCEDTLSVCDIVICEDAIEGLFCFSVNKNSNEKSLEFSGFELPSCYKEKLPIGIADEYYAAALYELCGVSSLGKIKFKNIKLNDKTINCSELKELLTNLIKK